MNILHTIKYYRLTYYLPEMEDILGAPENLLMENPLSQHITKDMTSSKNSTAFLT